MKENRFYYRTLWPEKGLFCPLGRVSVRPMIRVYSVDSKIIPFGEIDKIAENIHSATYEEAAQHICEKLHSQYGGIIRVRVGENRLFAETEINLRNQ